MNKVCSKCGKTIRWNEEIIVGEVSGMVFCSSCAEEAHNEFEQKSHAEKISSRYPTVEEKTTGMLVLLDKINLNLSSIRSMLKFFTVLTIIGIIIGFIAGLIELTLIF